MITSPTGAGLRERKKRATLEAIERGAVELALEVGYENVTVEMICEVATISQRTFFNYAGSKENAVLGTQVPLPDEDGRAAFLAGSGNVLADLLQALAAELGRSAGDVLRKRQQVIRANPALALKAFARLEDAEDSIVALVEERLQAGRAGPGTDEEAKMVVALAFGIMHYAGRAWTETGFPEDLGLVLREAVDLARVVTGARPPTTPSG